MRGPLNLKFANNFIIYQKRPLRGRFGTDRLHSELWDWGVKCTRSLGIFYRKGHERFLFSCVAEPDKERR